MKPRGESPPARQREVAYSSILHRRRPAYYVGKGSFFAPLRCGGRTYPKGQKVPFTIKVWITTAQLSTSGEDVAIRVRATYTNSTRINRTPCVAISTNNCADMLENPLRRRCNR